uniref:Protein kinase domain-containing protein n=1 Tax=Ditylenchus dipsaci TaxID=166011 RepID=A0A915EUZ8_9BILA
MLSRFSKLVRLEHPHLCKYVELIRCHTASNGVVVISEHYQQTYFQHFSQFNSFDSTFAYSTAFQACSAIKYCHDNRIVIGLVSLDNILVDVSKPNHIKLAEYGTYHISGHNQDVDYIIGSAWYLAPERLIDIKHKCAASYKSDVWAFGIVLLEIFTGHRLYDIWGAKQIFSVLSAVISKANNESVLAHLLDAMQFACPSGCVSVPAEIMTIVSKCLQIYPSKRPSATEVLDMLENLTSYKETAMLNEESGDLTLNESIESMQARIQTEDLSLECFNRPLNELFYLWKLCGSSVENILITRGIIQMRPPVCTMPSLVVGEIQMFGNEETRTIHTTFHVCILPTKNLRARLQSIPLLDLCHSFELESEMGCTQRKASSISQGSHVVVRAQTLVVKERDIDYQVVRMRFFNHLLAVHPYKQSS